jgi:hypothetical protein
VLRIVNAALDTVALVVLAPASAASTATSTRARARSCNLARVQRHARLRLARTGEHVRVISAIANSLLPAVGLGRITGCTVPTGQREHGCGVESGSTSTPRSPHRGIDASYRSEVSTISGSHKQPQRVVIRLGRATEKYVTPFGPAKVQWKYERLSLIFERRRDYQEALDTCTTAITRFKHPLETLLKRAERCRNRIQRGE